MTQALYAHINNKILKNPLSGHRLFTSASAKHTLFLLNSPVFETNYGTGLKPEVQELVI
jgi:hypothetical protein